MSQNFSLKHIFIICAGTFLEVYDSYLFAFLMPEIARNFLKFSAHQEFLATLSFSIIFIIRPISGVLWGILGDKSGKSWVFRNSMLFMAVVTMLIGFLPTYDQIGMAAPILLLALRMLQGVSISGELSSAIVLLFEQSKPEQRYKNHSVLYTFLFGGFVIACLIVLLVKSTGSMSFYWRLPFIFGGIFGLAVYLIRRTIQFPERRHQVSIYDLFSNHLKPVLFGCFANCLVNINWLYMMTSTSILEKYQINSPHTGLICGIIASLSCFLSGRLFFKSGFKNWQIPLIITMIVTLHILMGILFIAGTPQWILIFYYSQAALSGLVFIAIPQLIVRASPEAYRNSIYTISVNFSTAVIIGGLPLVLSSMIHFNQVNLYLLLMGLGVIAMSLVGIYHCRKRFNFLPCLWKKVPRGPHLIPSPACGRGCRRRVRVFEIA